MPFLHPLLLFVIIPKPIYVARSCLFSAKTQDYVISSQFFQDQVLPFLFLLWHNSLRLFLLPLSAAWLFPPFRSILPVPLAATDSFFLPLFGDRGRWGDVITRVFLLHFIILPFCCIILSSPIPSSGHRGRWWSLFAAHYASSCLLLSLLWARRCCHNMGLFAESSFPSPFFRARRVLMHCH